MSLVMPTLWLALLLVCGVLAQGHDDLHTAIAHQSSRVDAAGIRSVDYGFKWIVSKTHDAENLLEVLNRHLTIGKVKVHEISLGGHEIILETTRNVRANELTTLLMSEQRAGRLEWFHRDRAVKRKSR